ncbi:AMP-dependent synthetase/ligase [Parvicella tangerina]|uniref:Long-chain-fatty-acid--CoA ligase FadD15 n=1 Tax=Parvicella tangerina TaxID=2829795 RepID=A0A916JLR0_9FLAO|nr:long-chain fatty acid--CoA ligase [Parvicella tangerina]CAG5080502.1 Long-chain-fatty-acid--CoA ligase FadD15 [Parvicella tangerina]
MKDIKRLFDIPRYQLEKYPQEICLAGKENGKWNTYSTEEYIKQANLMSHALRKLGVGVQDKVAIVSNNRPEWNIVDMGTLQIGAVDVPVYSTISEADYKFIFNDAEVKYCFVSDQELYNKVAAVKDEIPSLLEIFSFDKLPNVKHWTELLELGKEGDDKELTEIQEGIVETDLATLIYTSGTTGLPKGVMLSHRNLVENVKGSYPRLPVKDTSQGLSFLPLCHVYERMITYLYQYSGVSLYYAESIETIKDNIVEIKPHVFTAVPRLLEKVYDGIVKGGTESGGLKAAIFKWALGLTETYEYGKHPSFQRKIAEKLVYSKIRAKLGGNIQAIASGGAALQPRLARFYHAIGMPVYEGYGLTETSPVISVNALDSGVRFGTVGKKLDNVEVMIAEDGEICTKGPCLMMGYYKRKDLTDEVIDKDGWFHTGDIGELSNDGFLKITDRKKEMFKTSGGKYVAPQVLENKFKESQFIEQIMVIGEGYKHPSALIVPAFEFIKSWAAEKGHDLGKTNDEICKNETLIARIQQEVDKYNQNFGNWEQVKKFELLPVEWSVESGELTPKLSFKRKVILANNQHLVDKIYAEK